MSASVALVGNPNTGKSLLFNGLTGGKQKVGNWPGVTVDGTEGQLLEAPGVTVIDLPGVYGFTAASQDEIMTRDYLLSRRASLVVNVADASNLERNLYLTVLLREAGIPTILVLNMMDIARNHGLSIDLALLEENLGIPVVPLCSHDPVSIQKTRNAIKGILESGKGFAGFSIDYHGEIKEVLSLWKPRFEALTIQRGFPAEWLALRVLESDPWAEAEDISRLIPSEELHQTQKRLKSILEEDVDVLVAEARFAYIHGLVKKTVTQEKVRVSNTEKLDRVLLNRYLGIPIFLGVMYAVFGLTIVVGGAFIDFFDQFFGALFVETPAYFLGLWGAPEWVKALIAGGLGTGIQTVATFVPIIAVMFFVLALLEDSGYISRAAFLMDRVMRSLGLPGKAFVPLLVGFGCTVPGIMAARTLESRKDRLITMFMAPLMSCGARLPVYALFAAAFFPGAGGTVVFTLYLAGMLLSVGTGFLLRKTIFHGPVSSFVMELPSYHKPRMRQIFRHAWRNLKGFIWKAGRVIVAMVAVLGILNTVGVDGSIGNEDSDRSLLSFAGKAVQPVFEPMGVVEENWPAAVALFTGLFAKEAVVGTMTGLYALIPVGEETDTTEKDSVTGLEEHGTTEEEVGFSLGGLLAGAFQTVPDNLLGVVDGFLDPFGFGVMEEDLDEETLGILGSLQRGFGNNPLQAYAYLLFILVYFPCVAAFGAAAKEMGHGWAWLSASYLTVLAWSLATLFYQVTVGGEIVWIIVSVAILLAFWFSLLKVGHRHRKMPEPGAWVPFAPKK